MALKKMKAGTPRRVRLSGRERGAKLRALLQRSHINHKPVLHITLEQTLVSLINLLNLDHLNVGGEAMIGAEIEHFLGLLNTADAGASQAMTPHNQVKNRNWQRLRRCSDHDHRAIAFEQSQILIQIVLRR